MPDPLADFEADLAASVQPAATEPAKPAPAPKAKSDQEAVEHKPRVANDNGKPAYALPVWKDLLDFFGHALNRLSDANRAAPNPKRYSAMEAKTKDLMNESRAWREESRKP